MEKKERERERGQKQQHEEEKVPKNSLSARFSHTKKAIKCHCIEQNG
jgi:hypothetical protein